MKALCVSAHACSHVVQVVLTYGKEEHIELQALMLLFQIL